MFDKIALQPFHTLSRSYIVNCSTSPNPLFQRVFSKSDFTHHELYSTIPQEFEALKSIEHPGLVPYTKIAASQNNILLERPYIQGESLNSLISRCGANTFEGAQYLSSLIIDAVYTIHKINRPLMSLSLNNIIVTQNSEIKLVDFGISSIAIDSNGTKDDLLSFLSLGPEGITSGKRETSVQLDIWNLGVVIFAVFCGYLPFAANNAMAIVQSIINNEVVFPGSGKMKNYSKIDAKIEKLIKSMLNPDPLKRPTITEVKKTIGRLRKGQELPANSYTTGFPTVLPFQERSMDGAERECAVIKMSSRSLPGFGGLSKARRAKIHSSVE
ncbi:CAMK family protein kinase [Tritrichomonas foetus]|uniref:non-specific serine/threonine protein kinase n=1 Tax=Tritrichomonas foetus TaxID=1144522 RepID=A0A1J4JRD9_9EUKA|nr:CAMK family protein kinase [Tritrichomonas foetus]|eukprot:OHT01000.1 CAMK family protein kinase [Tritrichomonas foetus]